MNWGSGSCMLWGLGSCLYIYQAISYCTYIHRGFAMQVPVLLCLKQRSWGMACLASADWVSYTTHTLVHTPHTLLFVDGTHLLLHHTHSSRPHLLLPHLCFPTILKGFFKKTMGAIRYRGAQGVCAEYELGRRLLEPCSASSIYSVCDGR